MKKISTIGLDLAKNVFQVHGVDASGAMVLRRQLRRAAVEKFFAQLPPCTVGMEACGSAHHWARVIGRHGRGGDLRGGGPANDAVRAGEEHRAASDDSCSRHAGPVGSATNDDSERAAGGTERAWDRGGAGI